MNQSTVIADAIHEGKYETKKELDSVRLVSKVAKSMMEEGKGRDSRDRANMQT
jgi:hypothetical protein